MPRAHQSITRFQSVAIFGLVITFAITPFVACGSSDARQGEAGDNCTKTDDCTPPLACRGSVCVDPNAATASSASSGSGGMGSTGSGGGTSTSTTGATVTGTGGAAVTSSDATTGPGGSTVGSGGSGASGTGGSGGAGGGGLDPVACAACVDQECATEEAACDANCLGIQACLEALCANLSANASPDEGACQVHCQQAHPGGKSPHLAVVNCAQSSSCGPCSSYPFDYDACVASADAGMCATPLADCNASADCMSYRDCTSQCSTLAECLACDDTPSGLAGSQMLLSYEQCIAGKCIAEAWLQ